jgi:hypothetical protein
MRRRKSVSNATTFIRRIYISLGLFVLRPLLGMQSAARTEEFDRWNLSVGAEESKSIVLPNRPWETTDQ